MAATNRLSNKQVLITGATSGIGAAAAKHFALMNCKLIITGRREKRLRELAQTLQDDHDVEVSCFAFDIRSADACENCIKAIKEPVDILVNNAGLAAGADPVYDALLDDWERMIDTNVKGLLYMSRLVSRQMRSRNAGHIINIGSIAGHESYPGGVTYSGTKHAVKAITEATKKDLHGTKVRVSLISPGLVETEFSEVRFSGDKEKAKSVYAGMEPLTADDIAEVIVFIANRPAHVNVMDSLIYPVYQSSAQMVHRDE